MMIRVASRICPDFWIGSCRSMPPKEHLGAASLPNVVLVVKTGVAMERCMRLMKSEKCRDILSLKALGGVQPTAVCGMDCALEFLWPGPSPTVCLLLENGTCASGTK